VRKKLTQVGLITLMFIGGLMLWLGDPVIWLWIGSHMTTSQQARLGPYMAVGGGILVSTVLVALFLARVNRLYIEATDTRQPRVRLPWLRSLRGESDSRPEVTVLDFVLVTTAVTGILAAVVWFFAFAGSSLPG
jgi:hypothetical protein